MGGNKNIFLITGNLDENNIEGNKYFVEKILFYFQTMVT